MAGIENDVVSTTFSNFNGDIAALRYYENQVFNLGQVQQNYMALIPEPSSATLLVLGAACLAMMRRRGSA